MHYRAQVLMICWIIAASSSRGASGATTKKIVVSPEVLTTFARNLASALSPTLLLGEIRGEYPTRPRNGNGSQAGEKDRPSRADNPIESYSRRLVQDYYEPRDDQGSGPVTASSLERRKNDVPDDVVGDSVGQFERYQPPPGYDDYRFGFGAGSSPLAPYGPFGYYPGGRSLHSAPGHSNEQPNQDPPDETASLQDDRYRSRYIDHRAFHRPPFHHGFYGPPYDGSGTDDRTTPGSETEEAQDAGNPERNEDGRYREYQGGPFNGYDFYRRPSFYHPYGSGLPENRGDGNGTSGDNSRGVDFYPPYPGRYPSFGHPYGYRPSTSGERRPEDDEGIQNSTVRPIYGPPIHGSFHLGGYPSFLPYGQVPDGVFRDNLIGHVPRPRVYPSGYPHFTLSDPYPPFGGFSYPGSYRRSRPSPGPKEEAGPGGNGDVELVSESKLEPVRRSDLDKRQRKVYQSWKEYGSGKLLERGDYFADGN